MKSKLQFLVLSLLIASPLVAQNTSDLWGNAGELWDPRGRLPDFSYAGYGGGNATMPSFDNVINVASQPGVNNTDFNSDVQAIQSIINDAPENSVIYFPEGRYVIDRILQIKKNNIVLRGDGVNRTEFYLPKSATEASPPYQRPYSTGDNGQLIQFVGDSNNSNLTRVVEHSLRSDKVIIVENASQLRQWDIIEIGTDGNNPRSGELWHEYFNNQSQDWPGAEVNWVHGNSLSMFHTIEKIEGNMVTLREPLRLRLKPSWGVYVRQRNRAVSNVGIEDIELKFKLDEKKPHLQEVGYNALLFREADNFWAKNIRIVNCDNGILVHKSSFGELNNVNLTGRNGHHGFKVSGACQVLSTNVQFNIGSPYSHSFTYIHKANGNVTRNMSGDNSNGNDNTISLDFHRTSPFSNLWTDVRSKNSFKSSGDPKAGPHAGARNVYWNLQGTKGSLHWGDESDWRRRWGEYQCTLVTDININEIRTQEKEWYEDVPNVSPSDLYSAQRTFRLENTPETIFNTNAYGNRNNWNERDASRWRVKPIGTNNRYFLEVFNLQTVPNGKLAEYSIINTESNDANDIAIAAKLLGKFEDRNESDIAIVTSFKDHDNYIFGRLSTNTGNSGIFRVANGKTTKLAGSGFELTTNDYVELKLEVIGNNITFKIDDAEAAVATNVSNISGKVGVGSSKNGLIIREAQTDATLSVTNYDVTQKSINIYPNPVQDTFTITLQNLETPSIEIYNLRGQLMHTVVRQEKNTKIATKGILTSGIYIVKITDANTNNYYKKIVVQ